MQEDPTTEREPRATEPNAVPHVVTLERVGWLIRHQPPGQAIKTTGAHVEKAGALQQGVITAQQLADQTGATVELHTQDSKGRPSGTRYFEPTPKDTPEKDGAK